MSNYDTTGHLKETSQAQAIQEAALLWVGKGYMMRRHDSKGSPVQTLPANNMNGLRRLERYSPDFCIPKIVAA